MATATEHQGAISGVMRRQERVREPARDHARFSALYDEHFAFVWRVLRRLGLHGAATEDAAQEVWLVVFRHLDQLDPSGSPRPWLYTIARRVAWRQRRTRTRAERKIRALAVAPARRETAVDARIEATTVIESYLDRLPAEQRQVFVLAELLAMTGKEIAAAVGIKQATAYSRLRLARERLEAMVAADEHDSLVRLARDADRPADDQPQRTWALVVPSLGVPGASLPMVASPAAPAAAPATLATLGERAFAAITASPAISGAASALVATLVFFAAATSPVDVDPDASTSPAHALVGDRADVDPGSEDSRLISEVGDVGDVGDVGEFGVVGVVGAVGDVGDVGDVGEVGKVTDLAATGEVPTLARTAEPIRDGRSAQPGRDVAASGRDEASRGEPAAEAASDEPLVRETALLMAARQAIARKRPEQALALLDQHSLDFDDGALVDVREATRVEALCALGRDAEAIIAADALAHSHPSAAAAQVASRVASRGCDAAASDG